MHNSIEENIKTCNEIKKVIKENNQEENKLTYAQSMKNNTVMPEVIKKIPLIVKPKEKQGVEKTKEELNKKVNPVNLKISNVENRKNGTIVIQTETIEEREKIKKAIQNEMNEDYEIKVPNPIEMTIKITDMTFKFSESELLDKIKRQNLILKESEIKIIRMYEFKRNNKTINNVKCSIDVESYKNVMAARRINIGWEKCRVFDGTEILQCFKCKGFNHKYNECTNDEICIKCHGNHKTKECEKEVIEKCINCVKINRKLNLGLEENHYTMDKQCPVYQNKLNIKKRRNGLNF